MAEHLFVKGGHIKDAVEMYTAAGHWEEAHKVSTDTLQHSFKYSVFSRVLLKKISLESIFKNLMWD